MTHEDVREIVMNPEEFAPEERREAERHLSTCAECRTSAEDWRLARALLSERRVAPSEAFVQRVMARIDSPTVASRSPWWAPVAALALAAAAGLLAVVPRDAASPFDDYMTGAQPAGPVDVLEQMMEEA